MMKEVSTNGDGDSEMADQVSINNKENQCYDCTEMADQVSINNKENQCYDCTVKPV
jgi:PP-loop superfamily ATP-utilizing enzyme